MREVTFRQFGRIRFKEIRGKDGMKRTAFIVAVLGCLSGATGAFGELDQVTIDQAAATPGMVLRHNVHYVVKGSVEIDASGLPRRPVRCPTGRFLPSWTA